MSYFGKPTEGAAPTANGTVSATIDSLQEQINTKAPSTGAVLASATTLTTPPAGDNSKSVTNTEYVDRAVKSTTVDFLLMAAGII